MWDGSWGELLVLLRSSSMILEGPWWLDSEEEREERTLPSLKLFESDFLLNLRARKRLKEDFFFWCRSLVDACWIRRDGELLVTGLLVIYASSKGGGMSIREVGVETPLDE